MSSHCVVVNGPHADVDSEGDDSADPMEQVAAPCLFFLLDQLLRLFFLTCFIILAQGLWFSGLLLDGLEFLFLRPTAS